MGFFLLLLKFFRKVLLQCIGLVAIQNYVRGVLQICVHLAYREYSKVEQTATKYLKNIKICIVRTKIL